MFATFAKLHNGTNVNLAPQTDKYTTVVDNEAESDALIGSIQGKF